MLSRFRVLILGASLEREKRHLIVLRVENNIGQSKIVSIDVTDFVQALKEF